MKCAWHTFSSRGVGSNQLGGQQIYRKSAIDNQFCITLVHQKLGGQIPNLPT